MEIIAAVKPELNVSSPELVQIIANVLENALHGAIESKTENPFIKVVIKHKYERLVIVCENSCKQDLIFNEMPEYLYGIGLHSIIATAEKYNGVSSFSASNGVFIAKIVIDE